jgi:hypothetical protein
MVRLSVCFGVADDQLVMHMDLDEQHGASLKIKPPNKAVGAGPLSLVFDR